MLDRRRFLVLGAGAGGAVLVPRALGAGAEAATAPATAAGEPAAAAEPFSRPMPLPPEATPAATVAGTDLYRLDLRPTTVEILPGRPAEVLTYAPGFLGGPVVRARRGRPVALLVRNHVTAPANVHLHGGHVPAASDGHPMDLIEPGSARLYRYPNRQAAATLWYHDHSHHTESEHVYRGMHGLYLLEDPAERRLRLPRGRYDVPIMLRDAKVDPGGALVSGPPTDRPTVLANGVPQPYFAVAARRYRFRLLNCSTTRLFRFDLAGAVLTQIGSDGGLLPAPVPRTALAMGAGERVEVVVDFSAYPPGSQLVLSDAVLGPVLRFDVVAGAAADASAVPAALRPLPVLPPSTVDRDVVLTMDVTTRPPTGLINGRPFDPDRTDLRITRGATETWHVVNGDTNFPHTIHLHLVQFQVLSRDGGPPNADDAGLKDTVQLRPGESVTLRATFDGHLGRYAFHCHMLDHSRVGMMAQMEIVP